jgi:hypothetical protein
VENPVEHCDHVFAAQRKEASPVLQWILWSSIPPRQR